MDKYYACNKSRRIQRLQRFEARGHSEAGSLGWTGAGKDHSRRGHATRAHHSVGGYPQAKAPLVLGGEGAGVVEGGGGTAFPVGSRVMFTGPYGVSENGTYSEWLAVRQENLRLIPDNIEDLSAAGVPVAYLTAQMTLSFAGFAKGKTVLSPAIGGSVGNAVTQTAKAQGAKHAISTTTSHAKAQQARSLGFRRGDRPFCGEA